MDLLGVSIPDRGCDGYFNPPSGGTVMIKYSIDHLTSQRRKKSEELANRRSTLADQMEKLASLQRVVDQITLNIKTTEAELDDLGNALKILNAGQFIVDEAQKVGDL